MENNWLKTCDYKDFSRDFKIVKIPEPKEKADMALRKDEAKTPHGIVPTIIEGMNLFYQHLRHSDYLKKTTN